MKMMLIVVAVTVFNVLTQGYCQGNSLEIQVTLTENTRVAVCVCSDADTCTADNWKDLLAECRKKAANVGHEVMEQTSASTKEPTTSTQEPTTSTPEPTTSTAQPTTTTPQPTTSTPQPTTSTQSSCVSDCTGMADGKYQSCKGCTGYAECSYGHLKEGLCGSGTLWDDISKTCTFPESSTCV
ncbi:uncharacterized protein [Haliotis cracherodii]|uniref:uncharacterized protein n=1 Tax=Haliotis cracherodii TaxID=6455 RepID=UPI0039E8A4A5